VSPQLQQLIALQEVDLKINELADRIAAIPNERERVLKEFNDSAADYHALVERLETARQTRRKHETELQEQQSHQDKYKQDLMKVRNEKEYATALREIDAAKKTISTLETHLLEAIEEVEKLEEEVKVHTPEITTKQTEIDNVLQGFNQNEDKIRAEQERIRQEREQLIKGMAKNLLSTYERVARMRKGLALAEARNSSCTACRMTIRPQVFSNVRKGEELIQCDSCGRILYYKVQGEPQPSATAEVTVS
jgi:predicted  nucleic acid-binding Zn-ribbon protein